MICELLGEGRGGGNGGVGRRRKEEVVGMCLVSVVSCLCEQACRG